MSEFGRVVWHDCMTTDIDRSVDFYTELFGWQISEVPVAGFGNYKMIQAGDEKIGGFVPLEPALGLPPHWIAYVSVDGVAAAAERAKAAGGDVAVPPTLIPDVGTFCVVKDPSGAHISPFKSNKPYSEERDEPPGAGKFCWEELLTSDPEAMVRFYGELFGWTADAMDMGEMGTYHIFKRGARATAGTMKMPPAAAGAPPHWISYIQTDDVDATAQQATGLGARQLCPPCDIPDIGRFAVLADPTGGSFALFKSAAKYH